MKKFIITMDTEGDNLWAWKPGMPIHTENTRYLRRFQNLCERYGFRPVWLTNYEMICDPRYVDFISNVEEKQTGELGMHLHAWNNPPEYNLPVAQNGAPYLIEYPIDIMEQKIKFLTEEITHRTGITPVSHRAGRWAMNQDYFDLLIRYGYQVDCSVTPHINWADSAGQSEGARGTDYSAYPEKPYNITASNGNGSILEVPVSVRKADKMLLPLDTNLKYVAKTALRTRKGMALWLRPDGHNLTQMKYLADRIRDSDDAYLMFMLHSSELMPGGSPTFQSEGAIEKLYADMEKLFSCLSQDFEGITLRDFAQQS